MDSQLMGSLRTILQEPGMQKSGMLPYSGKKALSALKLEAGKRREMPQQRCNGAQISRFKGTDVPTAFTVITI